MGGGTLVVALNLHRPCLKKCLWGCHGAFVGWGLRIPSIWQLGALVLCPEESRGIEEEPSHLPLVVCVDKLTKIYKTDKKMALNKLSLNLYENQVVSFLGHNGAGKTTTM